MIRPLSSLTSLVVRQWRSSTTTTAPPAHYWFPSSEAFLRKETSPSVWRPRWLQTQYNRTFATIEKKEKKKPKNPTSTQNKEETDQVTSTLTKRRTWDENYALLLEFYKEHKHATPCDSYSQDPRLVAWVRAQRRSRGKLRPERKAKLEQLGIVWSGSHKLNCDSRWDAAYQDLVEFHTEHGHCKVPAQYEPNPKLANWVREQRRQYNRGEIQQNPHRFGRLEALGFSWRLRPQVPYNSAKFDEQWEEALEQLVAFQEKYGHCRVSANNEDYPFLAGWVFRQRRLRVKNQLLPDRKKKLDEIGFTWDFDDISEESWNQKFRQLCALKEQGEVTLNDDPDTTRNSGDDDDMSTTLDRSTWTRRRKVEDDAELNGWEHRQQQLYLAGTLHPKREAKLEDIGYWKSLGLVKPNEDSTTRNE